MCCHAVPLFFSQSMRDLMGNWFFQQLKSKVEHKSTSVKGGDSFFTYKCSEDRDSFKKRK